MEEIAKLKLFIEEFENSNTPLTKPKKDKTIDKKPVEIKQEDIIQELPPPKTQSQEIQQVSNNIVEEVKPEKKKRNKTPAQMEALKKAQEVRKANIEKGKKQKEYESALKLLDYLQTQKEQSKPKSTKQYKNKKIVSESDLEEEQIESESEEEEPIQKQREMKSMKNKKYSNTQSQSYKPKYNFFAD
jgi:hypothetical protein